VISAELYVKAAHPPFPSEAEGTDGLAPIYRIAARYCVQDFKHAFNAGLSKSEEGSSQLNSATPSRF
jgi:hypothetical protein